MKNILVLCHSTKRCDEEMRKMFGKFAGLPTKANLTEHTIEVCATLFTFKSISECPENILGMDINDLIMHDECHELKPEVLEYIKSRIKKEIL